VITKDHIFRFGRWFTFSVRLDAALLALKRSLLPAMCTDMKIYLYELTGIFLVVPFFLHGGKNVYLFLRLQICNLLKHKYVIGVYFLMFPSGNIRTMYEQRSYENYFHTETYDEPYCVHTFPVFQCICFVDVTYKTISLVHFTDIIEIRPITVVALSKA
jgi:hypothetical protein